LSRSIAIACEARGFGHSPQFSDADQGLALLRPGAPWRDLPDSFGPYTTCYNRFVRWRRAGVWCRIMDALAAGHLRAEPDLRHTVAAQQRARHSRDRLNERSFSSREIRRI